MALRSIEALNKALVGHAINRANGIAVDSGLKLNYLGKFEHAINPANGIAVDLGLKLNEALFEHVINLTNGIAVD